MATREEISGYLRTETGEEYHIRHRREEIREGIQLIYCQHCPRWEGCVRVVDGATEGCLSTADFILALLPYLHSQGMKLPNGEPLVEEK